MIKTKEKILAKSKELFNTLGSDVVTVRRIAKDLDMSHGNLCYHFPSTDHIIEKLYFLMIGELDALIENPVPRFYSTLHNHKLNANDLRNNPHNALTLRHFHTLTRRSFEILYDYRFLMLDFVRIIRRLPVIKDHYRKLTARRIQLFQLIIDQMVQNKTVRPEIVEGQFMFFIKQVLLFGDFWLSEAEVLFEGEEGDKISTYHNLCFAMITPYLTEKGIEEYRQLDQEGIIATNGHSPIHFLRNLAQHY